MLSHRISILVMLSLVAVLIAGINTLRYHEFTAQHEAVAAESVRGITVELMRFIRDRKRLVTVFTQDHRAMLEALVHHPDDEALYLQLDMQVQRYFPDYSVYAITDPMGNLVVHDFNFLVGEMCLEDIRTFTESGIQRPRVHPSMNVHHFDLLGEFELDGQELILLISFNANILGSMLNNMQTPDHQLLLILDDANLLVEASAAGSRRDFYRPDYHLNDAEAGRILQVQNVPGTMWRVMDLHVPQLFNRMRNQLVLEGLAIFAVFATLSGIMLVFLRREERRRQKAEGMKDEFLSVVSHELRTPITSMMGSLGLMANEVAGELPPRAKQLAGMALSNCERLLLLVNDILDIQRIEAGRLEIERQVVDLNLVIQDAMEHNESYAEKFGSHFMTQEQSPRVMVYADPHRLSQVLDNLLSNAVKYGGEQDEIIVRVAPQGQTVRVSVEDHGPGIPDDFRDVIFQKFSQSDSSHRRRRDGTGLGLFIARNLIEQHDGRMGFESVPGKGSTFWFELPLHHGRGHPEVAS